MPSTCPCPPHFRLFIHLWTLFGRHFYSIPFSHVHTYLLYWSELIWPLFGDVMSCQVKGNVLPFGMGTRPPEKQEYSPNLAPKMVAVNQIHYYGLAVPLIVPPNYICGSWNGFSKPYKLLWSSGTIFATGKWSSQTIFMVKKMVFPNYNPVMVPLGNLWLREWFLQTI